MLTLLRTNKYTSKTFLIIWYLYKVEQANENVFYTKIENFVFEKKKTWKMTFNYINIVDPTIIETFTKTIFFCINAFKFIK